jgi:hypothetical protein
MSASPRAGRLSRECPEVLRWLLFEAAKTSARACAPGHNYYTQAKGPRRPDSGTHDRRPLNRCTVSAGEDRRPDVTMTDTTAAGSLRVVVSPRHHPPPWRR